MRSLYQITTWAEPKIMLFQTPRYLYLLERNLQVRISLARNKQELKTETSRFLSTNYKVQSSHRTGMILTTLSVYAAPLNYNFDWGFPPNIRNLFLSQMKDHLIRSRKALQFLALHEQSSLSQLMAFLKELQLRNDQAFPMLKDLSWHSVRSDHVLAVEKIKQIGQL